MLPRFSLRSKFLFSMLGITAALTAGLLLAVQVRMRAHAREEIQRELDGSIATFQNFNSRREALSMRMAGLLANMLDVQNLLAFGDNARTQDATTVIASGAGGQMFVLADAGGKVVALHTTSVMGPQLVQPLMTRALENHLEEDWWYADGRLYEVFFRPVRAGGQLLGTLGFGFEIDQQLAADVGNIAGANVIFLYGKQPVVSTLTAAARQQLQPELDRIPAVTRSAPELRLGGRDYLAARLPLAQADFDAGPALVVLKSLDEETANLRALNRMMLVLGVIALLAGLALVQLISRAFTRPLESLMAGVRALEKGDYSYPLVASSQDEIGELTEAFARMRSTLRQNQEGMLRSARMEALGQLAGGVAHDFNNVVTIINGYSELAQDAVGPESSVAGHLQQIREAGRRASSLTRQLLAFSRKQVVQPQVLEPNAELRNLERMLRVLVGENIEVELRLGERVPPVLADSGQLEQIIFNLAANARDAMPGGGKLQIATNAMAAGERSPEGTVASQPMLRISVGDNGMGMDAATMKRIFEPFFTTKETGKGTGLGLATVYGIVQQSGGWIEVQSQPGQGTRFEIFLPAHTAAAPPAAAPLEREAAAANGGTVLIVEDEDSLRRLVAEALSAKKFKVLQAKDGMSGIEMARSYNGRIDLVITDIVMPRLGGREMTPLLLEARPEIKILYVSGYTDRDLTQLELGTRAEYLQKPFSARELVKKVEVMLAPAGSAAR